VCKCTSREVANGCEVQERQNKGALFGFSHRVCRIIFPATLSKHGACGYLTYMLGIGLESYRATD